MNSLERRVWVEQWMSRLSNDMEIRAISKDGQPVSSFFGSRDPAVIAAQITEWESHHLYFGVLGREGGKGTKEAVKDAHCLWADIDFKDLHEGQIEADGILATFDHKPSLLIHSGGGYHVYWFLEEPTTDVDRVERILKGLAPRLKADVKVAERARVLRVPETMNWKYDPPRKVTTISYEQDYTYTLDDFAEWELPAEEPKPVDLGIESEERLDVKKYLKRYNVPVVKTVSVGTATLYCLKTCIFDDQHTDKGRVNDAAIGQTGEGKLFYQCFHEGCAGTKWVDAKERISGKDSLIPFVMRDLKPLVEKYVNELTGSTSIGALLSWYDVKSPAERQEVMEILNDMAASRVIVWTGNKHGVFRKVDKTPKIMQIGGRKKKPLDIELPLDLHTLVHIYKRNIILVAGEKDAGKTAFAMNVGWMNRNRMSVTYINSEMGEDELEARLMLFPDNNLKEWKKITFIERSSKFEDVIDPNGLNIIDFLEIGKDAFEVVDDIKRVFDRLNDGVLLIVMQKRSYKEYAVGGEGTLEKARLAVNLEHRQGIGNVCRITVAKNWTGRINHPRGYECGYKVFSGGRMTIEPEWWIDPERADGKEPKQKRLRMPTKKKDPDFYSENE